jgi:hypothetical protein
LLLIFQHSINTTVPNGIQGYNWCFTQWSDGNASKSRNIIVNSDVNLVANYKKHLLSSSSTALANTNQRKIAQNSNGMYFMVYEKDNKIWFSKSSDGINDWTNEVEVSGGLNDYSIYKSPSIHASDNYVAIVWQGINETSGGFDGSNIYFRLYNNATNTWSATEPLPWFEPSYGSVSH